MLSEAAVRQARPEHRRQGADERGAWSDESLCRGGDQDQLHRSSRPTRGSSLPRRAPPTSPFVGRLDDINQDGMIVVRDWPRSWRSMSSRRSSSRRRSATRPQTQAALAGAHVATVRSRSSSSWSITRDRQGHHPVPLRLDKARKALAERTGKAPRRSSRPRQSLKPATRSEEERVAVTERCSASSWVTIVPGHLDSEVEELLLGLRRSAHPAPGQSDVLRHRRLGLSCDHMFRRFGTPFAVDWLAKNVNGYVYTTRSRSTPHPHRWHRVQLPLSGACAARRVVLDWHGCLPRHRPAGLRRALADLVA